MKKIFSLFAAVLFAGSMMAGSVVFSGADFTGGTANTGSAFSVTKDGVTVSSDKAYGTGEELRIYQEGALNVTASENITKISAEFGKNTKMTFDDAEPNAKNWSVAADKQIRITKLTVVIDGEGGGDDPGEGGEGGDPADMGDAITCAEAAQLALNAADPTADNKNVEVQASVKIRGYVTWVNSVKDSKQSAWIADDASATSGTVQGYNLAVSAAVAKGDFVELNGKLVKYFKAGKDGKEDEIVLEVTDGTMAKVGGEGGGGETPDPQNLGKKTIAEFLALKDEVNICILSGEVKNIKNTEYGNFDLEDATGSVYIYGLLTPEGESKKFATLDIAEGDVITIQAKYSEYNGNPQVKNAIFVKKGEDTPVDNIMINAKGVKAIENGMLIIDVNGVRYNVVGQIVR